MIHGTPDIPNRCYTVAFCLLLVVSLVSCDDSPTKSENRAGSSPLLAPIVPVSEQVADESPLPEGDIYPIPGKKPLPQKPSTDLAPDPFDIPYDYPQAFPNRVGYWWEYERHNFLTDVIDTVRIEIVDTTTLPNGEKASVWQGDFFSEVWGPYVSVVKGDEYDTVKVWLVDGNLVFTVSIYVYPLLSGQKWSNLKTEDCNCFETDTSEVYPEDSTITPSGIFKSANRIIRYGTDGFEGSTFGEEWLVNGIGLVSSKRTHWTIGGRETYDVIWLLVDYKTDPF